MYTEDQRLAAVNAIIDFCAKNKVMFNTVEVGAGLPFAATVMNYSGASSVIKTAYSPYGWDVCKATYDLTTRAVSKETVTKIANDALSTNTNIRLVFSAQLGKTKHGWCCCAWNLPDGYATATAHFTLPPDTERKDAISFFSDHVIEFVLRFIGLGKFADMQYCDIFEMYRPLDAGSGDKSVEVFLESGYENATMAFDLNGETVRAVDVLRFYADENEQFNIIPVFKGSFNPPTVGHMKMMSEVRNRTGRIPVAVISHDTYDKGHSDAVSLGHRLRMLNKLGVPVILVKKPKFYDTFELFRSLGYRGRIGFIMGDDTLVRIFDDAKTSTLPMFMSTIGDSELFVFDRKAADKSEMDNVHWLNAVDDVSSTDVRNAVKTLEKYVPREILNQVIDAYTEPSDMRDI